MSELNIIRAWKDREYWQSLDENEKAMLPNHPAGLIELNHSDLDIVAGGNTEDLLSIGCCGSLTRNSGCCSVMGPLCTPSYVIIRCYPPPV